MENTRLV